MAYLIGTDEAGYGPNLGPLVISATMWQLPEQLLETDLYQTLGGAFTAATVRASKVPAADDAPLLTVADSKELYQSGGSLAPLEHAVLAVLATQGQRFSTWRDLLDALDPAAAEWRDRLPWYTDFELELPIDADSGQIAAAARRVGQTFEATGVSLCCVKSRILFAPQFNELVDRYDNKASVLSRTTLRLVADLIDQAERGPIRVLCDKHGGRNRYAALLQEVAGSGLVRVVVESRAESRYRFSLAERQVDIRFIAKGERFLPSALASMTSKYARELAMMGLNRYWCDRVDGLKPTAGYPVDARRWREAIQVVEEGRQVSDRQLWRCR